MTGQTQTALAAWFERSGFKQREVAERLGITEGHLSLIVNGKRQPSLTLAVKISELTGISSAELLKVA